MWVSKTCSNQCLPAVNKGLKALNTCCYNERTCCLVPPRARLGNQKETRQQCCLLRARRLSWKLIQSGNWIFMFENIHKPGGMYKVWGTGRRILENISTMIFKHKIFRLIEKCRRSFNYNFVAYCSVDIFATSKPLVFKQIPHKWHHLKSKFLRGKFKALKQKFVKKCVEDCLHG